MKTLFIILGVAVALLLVGCGSITPSQSPAPEQKVVGGPSDYGPCPTNCAHFVDVWIHVNLKDPESVKDLKIFTPIQTQHTSPVDGVLYYCWGIGFSLNAKNSYGAYAGEKINFVYVRDDKIVDAFAQ